MAKNMGSVWCGSATTVDSEEHSEGYVGLTTMSQEQPQSQMPSQAYTNYAMGQCCGFNGFQEQNTEAPVSLTIYMFAKHLLDYM